MARPATVPVSSPDGIDTSGAVIEIDPALRRPNLMVFEQLFRYSPRRRASPRIAGGFSPTASAVERIKFSISISPTARAVERIKFSISISPPEAKMERSRNPDKGQRL